MARIAGVDIPREKRLEISLTYIFGIGRATAAQICEAGLDRTPGCATSPTKRSTGSAPDVDQDLEVEGDLRREVQQNIRRMIEIGCYRGSATAAASRSVASAPRPTPAPARARKKTVAGKKKVRK